MFLYAGYMGSLLSSSANIQMKISRIHKFGICGKLGFAPWVWFERQWPRSGWLPSS